MVVLFSCVAICVPTVYGGPAETVAYIKGLLAADKTKRVAVLVIDMQERYQYSIDPVDLKSISGAHRQVILSLSDLDRVLFVNIQYLGYGRTNAGLKEDFKLAKERAAYRIFTKEHFGAFEGVGFPGREDLRSAILGELGDGLKAEKITDIIPFGCFSASCVKETAEGAIKEGFAVHVDMSLSLNVPSDTLRRVGREKIEKAVQKEWDDLQDAYPALDFISAEHSPSGVCSL